MSKISKVMLGLSLLLFVVSYPTCQWGERVVKSEMAKYPAEFVAAHEFDMIFIRWVLPGIMMFFSAGLLFLVAIILWIVERSLRKQNTNHS